MALIGRTFSLGQVSASADRELYEYLNLYNQSVLDIGNHMKLTTSANTITVKDGACIVQGAYIQVTNPIEVDLEGLDNGYIVLTIDLSYSNDSVGTPGSGDYEFINNQLRIEAVNSLIQQPLRNGGTIYMQPLCSFINTGTGVTLTQTQEMLNFYDYTTKHTEVSISSAGSISATDIEIINAQGQTITKLSDELEQLNTKISNLDIEWLNYDSGSIVLFDINNAYYANLNISLPTLRKLRKTVRLEMFIYTKKEIPPNHTEILFTLNPAFRPDKAVNFSVIGANSHIMQVSVNPDGTVRIFPSFNLSTPAHTEIYVFIEWQVL